MFEHFSFRVPRYGEDAVRKNHLNRKVKFICNPEFEELFNSLFKGIDFDKLEREETEKDERPFRWHTEDDDEKDEESVNEPPSIFDMLNSGKEFGDIVAAKPKHTEIYNQAFGLDDNGNPIPLPEDDELDDEEDEEPYIHEPDVVYAEDDEEDDEVKDPYVFIANRLTFLIQTLQPIIFDTSIVETGIHAKVNYMSIAVNTDKTYPKVETVNDIAWVMRECNGSSEIRNEINEFLEGTEYGDICIFPSTIKRNGQEIPAVRFVLYPKRTQTNFGPAFLNHNK